MFEIESEPVSFLVYLKPQCTVCVVPEVMRQRARPWSIRLDLPSRLGAVQAWALWRYLRIRKILLLWRREVMQNSDPSSSTDTTSRRDILELT